MSRKVRRVSYRLDAKGIKALPCEEIVAILRGTDELIMTGGRALLSKILKGSREKKVLELGLDECPVYGYYKQLTLPEILARIDWMILNGYLQIQYDYRLPLLKYTPKGWEIERETFAAELLQEFDEMIASGKPHFDMEYLKDRNRGMILLLLDKVEATGDPKYVPLLKDWEKIDYQKVQKRIRQVVRKLSGQEKMATNPA
jgi:superfamily II DNA helicase RecQ